MNIQRILTKVRLGNTSHTQSALTIHMVLITSTRRIDNERASLMRYFFGSVIPTTMTWMPIAIRLNSRVSSCLPSHPSRSTRPTPRGPMKMPYNVAITILLVRFMLYFSYDFAIYLRASDMYSFSLRPREHSPYNRMNPPKIHVIKETWYSLSIQDDKVLEEEKRASYVKSCRKMSSPFLNPMPYIITALIIRVSSCELEAAGEYVRP